MMKFPHTAAIVAALLHISLLMSVSCDEGDPEGKCEIGCIEGSGYPCPCDPLEGCAGNAVCGAIDPDHNFGVCSIPCESDDDCVWEADCTAKRRCVLDNIDADTKTCAATCRDDQDCPLTMRCLENNGLKVCYPWTY